MSTTDTGASETKAGDIAKAVETVTPAPTDVKAGDITKSGEGAGAEARMVPESAFLEEKKSRKALEREVKTLRSQIAAGATDTEISDSVDGIAARHNLNRDALREVTQAIRNEVEAEVEARVSKRLAPIEQGARAEAIRKAFDTHFQKAMSAEGMEDFKDVVNSQIIFKLTLDPENASKTIRQIIEDTYGSAIAGRKSADAGKPKGGSTSDAFDPLRLHEEGYLDEVKANPVLKAAHSKYLEQLLR